MEALDDLMANFSDTQIHTEVLAKTDGDKDNAFAQAYGYHLKCSVQGVQLDGRDAFNKVIEQLQDKVERIRTMDPPADWKEFHNRFERGMKLHVEAYQEMTKTFDDGDRAHVKLGQEMVERALDVMEGKQAATS